MLLETLGRQYAYVTFDDLPTLQICQEDPERFLRLHPRPIIFDEIQRAPDLFVRL